jgi:hypothetical protein
MYAVRSRTSALVATTLRAPPLLFPRLVHPGPELSQCSLHHVAPLRAHACNPSRHLNDVVLVKAAGGTPGRMVLARAKSAEEVIERMSRAAPPTPDDVTVLRAGRRLDSREAVMEWLAEVDAQRAEKAAGTDARA